MEGWKIGRLEGSDNLGTIIRLKSNMTNNVTMNIAGIRLSINSERSLPINGYNPAYTSFLSNESMVNPSNADMTIGLTEEDIPELNNAKKVFDSNETWSMFENNRGIYILFQPPALAEPLWCAKVNRDFSKTTIYCGKKMFHDNNEVFFNPVCYPLDQILMMNMLPKRKGALIHAACTTANHKAFLFPGTSGAGKSTLSRQLRKSANVTLMSDDRIVVRKIDDHYKAFGTPWPGEEGIAENRGDLLSAIFFINHGDTNRVTLMKPKDALKRLIPTISIPWYDSTAVSMMLQLCDDVINTIPTYALYFKPGPEISNVLEEYFHA